MLKAINWTKFASGFFLLLQRFLLYLALSHTNSRQVNCRYSTIGALLERDQVSVADVMTLNKAGPTRNKCIATSNKCLTTSNKKLLETLALSTERVELNRLVPSTFSLVANLATSSDALVPSSVLVTTSKALVTRSDALVYAGNVLVEALLDSDIREQDETFKDFLKVANSSDSSGTDESKLSK